MKKILFVCLVGVALMMGACGEKESSDNGGATTATHDIVYYVDGENQQSTGLSDSQWNILLEGLLNKVEEGVTVTFYNERAAVASQRKEAVSFSTTDREEMKAWCTRMEDAGMTVTITGHILHSRWLVAFGVIAGIGTFLWEWLGIGKTLFMFLAGASPANLCIRTPILPCLTFLLFAFFGLALPGYMLKVGSKN